MNTENSIIQEETKELLTEIFTAPLEQRSELILEAENPSEVMQQIAPEETYLIYQSADEENLPELLEAMNITQQTFIADFVLWEKDIFHSGSFYNWINSLIASSSETLEKWLCETDLETLALGFGSMGAVIKRIDEETNMNEILPDNMATITLDDVFYFTLREESQQELLKLCFTLIYNNDQQNYIALMEGLINESASEIMENAFEFRQDRLSYFGFPSKEDAFKLYQPMTHEEFLKTEPKSFIDFHEFDEENQQIVHYPKPNFSREMFWDRVNKLIMQEDEDTVHQINLEIVWLVNKVTVTEGLSSFTPQQTKSIMQKVKSILNIALENLSQNDELKALNICKKYWLEYIFRLGMGQLIPLRQKAKNVFTIFSHIKETVPSETEESSKALEDFYDFLSPVFSKKTEGLLKNIPMMHSDKSDNLTFFTDMLAVKQSYTYIESLLAFFNLLKDIGALDLMKDQKYLQSHFTIDTFIWTMFANFCTSEEISTAPLSFQDLHHFAENVFKDEASFANAQEAFSNQADDISKSSLDMIINASLKTFKNEVKDLNLNKTDNNAEETDLFIMKY